MTVPEATVREDNSVESWEHNVRFARKSAIVKPEAESSRVQALAKNQLRLRI